MPPVPMRWPDLAEVLVRPEFDEDDDGGGPGEAA